MVYVAGVQTRSTFVFKRASTAIVSFFSLLILWLLSESEKDTALLPATMISRVAVCSSMQRCAKLCITTRDLASSCLGAYCRLLLYSLLNMPFGYFLYIYISILNIIPQTRLSSGTTTYHRLLPDTSPKARWRSACMSTPKMPARKRQQTTCTCTTTFGMPEGFPAHRLLSPMTGDHRQIQRVSNRLIDSMKYELLRRFLFLRTSGILWFKHDSIQAYAGICVIVSKCS